MASDRRHQGLVRVDGRGFHVGRPVTESEGRRLGHVQQQEGGLSDVREGGVKGNGRRSEGSAGMGGKQLGVW